MALLLLISPSSFSTVAKSHTYYYSYCFFLILPKARLELCYVGYVQRKYAILKRVRAWTLCIPAEERFLQWAASCTQNGLSANTDFTLFSNWTIKTRRQALFAVPVHCVQGVTRCSLVIKEIATNLLMERTVCGLRAKALDFILSIRAEESKRSFFPPHMPPKSGDSAPSEFMFSCFPVAPVTRRWRQYSYEYQPS